MLRAKGDAPSPATPRMHPAGTQEPNRTICAGERSGGDGRDPRPCGGTRDADAGAIEVCKAGTCVAGYCGDGVLEPGEQCDFGAANGAGTRVRDDVRMFSCTTNPNSGPQPPDVCAGPCACTTVVVNGDTGQHCVQGAPLANGTACGGAADAGAGTCTGGACVTALCGNGVVNAGEQCDFGAGNNVTGSGCEPDCQFSCQKTPADTCQTNLCAANPSACTANTGTNNTAGQKCVGTTELTACGDCSSTGVCVANQCAPSRCGDNCVDSRTGETCEPPGTATCDASCHTIAAAVCGNGKRETGEQCDDGNKINLDGCDSTCMFEQEQRATTVAIQYAADSFCAKDALGSAIASAAQGTLATALTDSVTAGTTSIEFKFLGLTDLTGTAQASGLELGVISGSPAAAPTGVTYPAQREQRSRLSQVSRPRRTTIDANRNSALRGPRHPRWRRVLTATNGAISITVSRSPALPRRSRSPGASVKANVGATSKPAVSTGRRPPGTLASENLDPTLQSFASMTDGLLCGNISAASLATVPPIPTRRALRGRERCLHERELHGEQFAPRRPRHGLQPSWSSSSPFRSSTRPSLTRRATRRPPGRASRTP